jgi:YggT family protein
MVLLHLLISLYIYLLVATAILSWFPTHNASSGLGQVKAVLHRLTEPVLGPLRRILPRPQFGGVGLDLSVLVALVALEFINNLI